MGSQEHKAIVRRLFEEVLNEGRLTAIDELVTPDYVSHAGAPHREDFKHIVMRLRAGFSDVRYTIEDMIAEGDKVVIRATMHGTHRGDYLGVPPTGKRVTAESIHMHSEYSATQTAATYMANSADPGSAAGKQEGEATRGTTLSSVHPKQTSRPDNGRQLASLVVALVLVIIFGLLPALYAWIVRFLLRRNMRRLREGDFQQT